ncbi:MAG: XRE family transcriptional regulator [Candidatus Magasanikbacteria bacterium]|nr:XRE family transcriptional regulator [Candidatus Magasanikbacteria bacterium]
MIYTQYMKKFSNTVTTKFKSLQLKIAGDILRLRKQKKLSQSALAKRLGTTQSNVARMEAGNQNFSLAMLVKVAGAFGKRLEVNLR